MYTTVIQTRKAGGFLSLPWKIEGKDKINIRKITTFRTAIKSNSTTLNSGVTSSPTGDIFMSMETSSVDSDSASIFLLVLKEQKSFNLPLKLVNFIRLSTGNNKSMGTLGIQVLLSNGQ